MHAYLIQQDVPITASDKSAGTSVDNTGQNGGWYLILGA